MGEKQKLRMKRSEDEAREDMEEFLRENGLEEVTIYGADAEKRLKVMLRKFRSGKVNILDRGWK